MLTVDLFNRVKVSILSLFVACTVGNVQARLIFIGLLNINMFTSNQICCSDDDTVKILPTEEDLDWFAKKRLTARETAGWLLISYSKVSTH